MNTDLIEVLLVEDDPGDVLMTREALAEHSVRNNLSVVGDGVDALEFLHKRGGYAGAPTPDLILLDLNLPRMDGWEVLAAVKADERLRHIPVVVLTTSGSQRDILGSYRRHASAYVTKPADFDQFVRAVHHIEEFFLGVARLPRL